MRSKGLLAFQTLVELKNYTILKGTLIMYAVLVDLPFVSICGYLTIVSTPKTQPFSFKCKGANLSNSDLFLAN